MVCAVAAGSAGSAGSAAVAAAVENRTMATAAVTATSRLLVRIASSHMPDGDRPCTLPTASALVNQCRSLVQCGRTTCLDLVSATPSRAVGVSGQAELACDLGGEGVRVDAHGAKQTSAATVPAGQVAGRQVAPARLRVAQRLGVAFGTLDRLGYVDPERRVSGRGGPPPSLACRSCRYGQACGVCRGRRVVGAPPGESLSG